MSSDGAPYLLVAGDFVETGGMDRANLALACFLADRGKPVHLVTHRVSASVGSHANIVVHRVKKPLQSYFLAGPLLDSAGRRCAARIPVSPLRTLVNGGNCLAPGVNWVHYVHCAYDSPIRGDLLRRAKSWAFRTNARRKERLAFSRARAIIANSERTREHLTDFLGIPSERIHRVYYGIDPERFRPPSPAQRKAQRIRLGWSETQPVVAFVGALGDRRKGFDTVFEAWSKLCADVSWDVNLAVIGSGAEMAAWKNRAAAKNLTSHIFFMGFRRDVPDILAACDALVAPTRYEAFGLGVQEAMCIGLPVFVSALAGVSELFPAPLQHLLLPDPDNVDDLIDRLRDWHLRGEQYRQRFVQFSDSLRTWTWDAMAQQIAGLMEQLA
jgi:glycosyltransferase involved in cell wall biosynthesis